MISAPNSPQTQARRENSLLPSQQEFIRAHYRFQDGRFFTAEQSDDNSVHCASDVAVPMWNHSTWFGAEKCDAAFFRESEVWHAKHGRRPVVYLIEDDDE